MRARGEVNYTRYKKIPRDLSIDHIFPQWTWFNYIHIDCCFLHDSPTSLMRSFLGNRYNRDDRSNTFLKRLLEVWVRGEGRWGGGGWRERHPKYLSSAYIQVTGSSPIQSRDRFRWNTPDSLSQDYYYILGLNKPSCQRSWQIIF